MESDCYCIDLTLVQAPRMNRVDRLLKVVACIMQLLLLYCAITALCRVHAYMQLLGYPQLIQSIASHGLQHNDTMIVCNADLRLIAWRKLQFDHPVLLHIGSLFGQGRMAVMRKFGCNSSRHM